jgi:MYXO-CTERM domain-containing protein
VLQTPEWPFGSGLTVEAGAVLGKYAYFGDADLNGMVTADDYAAIDSNLGTHVGTALETGGMNWFAGDWNLDGDITSDDYGGVDANMGCGDGNPLAANGAAAVPEPVTALFGAALLGLVRRRRK